MIIKMEFNELLYKRRSVRAFTEREVTRGEIDTLLEAATRAPNACNMQSWHFYVVTDGEVRAKFADICATWATTAPVIFVVCTDNEALVGRFGERAKLFTYQDTALAAENLLLAAADMGLNGCFMGAFDAGRCRALLNIPEKHEIVALIPVGEAQTESPLRERKPMSDVVTYIGEAASTVSEARDDRYVLRDTIIKHARFENINMTGVEFDNIKMADGSFNNINMSGVSFSDINMTGAKFGGMCMNKTSFGCVDMREARFDNPDLRGTEFRNCNFSDVKLDGCELSGMTIDGINVAEALEFYRKNK
ncbi:MAG: nitroreductase family protein [Clostridia bacterium]|nr:nitroreductase family protein [Clostridia bacterium]